jgi:hypothetical protein
LPHAVPIVTSDLETLASAFADAARRRMDGEHFAAAVFIDDPRALFALYQAAPPMLAQTTDQDERARLFDALARGGLVLNGTVQRDMERYDARYLRSAHELLATADVVVTRSSVERERLSALVDRRFLRTVTLAPLDARVPAHGARDRDASAIVVWAPDFPAEACGIFAYALEEFRRPAFVICGQGVPAVMRPGTRFVPVADAANVLAQAAVIVDASISDPGAARALARWRLPLAATSCSGALDWLDGIAILDPWDYRSITAAVANALGARSPRERSSIDGIAELQASLAHAAIPPCTGGPLVSVIVPTMNRRASLAAALTSIANQTYPRLEIVIVNDGGPPLERGVLETERTLRIVEYAENRGVSRAVNAGIAESCGKYIAILADDDLFCPDHLSRLVDALERSGGDVAHAIELGEHLEQRASGDFSVIGYSLIAGQPATPATLQTCNVIGGPSILFTRKAFDRVGGFDERAGHLMDFEMWLRMSLTFDFIHVDRVTAVMTMRDDASQASAVTGEYTAELYRTIYGLHPTARSTVAESRERQIGDVAAIPVVRTLPQLRI